MPSQRSTAGGRQAFSPPPVRAGRDRLPDAAAAVGPARRGRRPPPRARQPRPPPRARRSRGSSRSSKSSALLTGADRAPDAISPRMRPSARSRDSPGRRLLGPRPSPSPRRGASAAPLSGRPRPRAASRAPSRAPRRPSFPPCRLL